MRKLKEFQSVLAENGGAITAAQANKTGVSNERLRLLVKTGQLVRAQFGVYVSGDEFIDKMFIAQLRRPKIVYSHGTALFLHNLTDRDPLSYTVTVPTGYNPSNLQKDGFRVFNIKRDLHRIGLTKQKTIFGNPVWAYDMERTICDCLRSRNQLEPGLCAEALKRYLTRKERNLNSLTQMADLFSVGKLLRTYLEVLL